MGIGENIRQARKAKGLTQTELGKALGVSMQAVSQYERGLARPSIENFQRMAAALDCDVMDLMGLPADTPTAEQPPAASPVERVGAAMNQLNATGQAVAADFVEGLAEVPKYQAQKEKPPQGT